MSQISIERKQSNMLACGVQDWGTLKHSPSLYLTDLPFAFAASLTPFRKIVYNCTSQIQERWVPAQIFPTSIMWVVPQTVSVLSVHT